MLASKIQSVSGRTGSQRLRNDTSDTQFLLFQTGTTHGRSHYEDQTFEALTRVQSGTAIPLTEAESERRSERVH